MVSDVNTGHARPPAIKDTPPPPPCYTPLAGEVRLLCLPTAAIKTTVIYLLYMYQGGKIAKKKSTK